MSIKVVHNNCKTTQLFQATYNIEMNRRYGFKNLHRFLNLAVIDFYLAIYIKDRDASICPKWASVWCKRNGSFPT